MPRKLRSEGLVFESVYQAPEPFDPHWHKLRRTAGHQRIALRAMARIDGQLFEFTWLGERHEVEVYDYPKSWGGVPRFVGHMPLDSGARLVTLARKWASDRHVSPEGKEVR